MSQQAQIRQQATDQLLDRKDGIRQPLKCIHQLFEEQVECTPDAVALISAAQQLTYAELNTNANQLARHLRSLGVGPETLVGLCVECSSEMVVGLLGILKAGGAYLPLDPHYPLERMKFMLDDSGISLLLTQEAMLDRLEPFDGRTVCLDAGWRTIAHLPGGNLANQAQAENLAYAIYTSGSTGRPKGVLVEHQAVVNHALAIGQAYTLTARDRVLQFAALSFDVAAEEIFPSLLAGATVVLRPPQAQISLFELLRFVQQHGVTVLNLPAAYWHQWVLALDESPVPPSVRLVVTGSDKVLAERLRTWQAKVGPQVAWVNAYGLTETTITSTLYAPATNGHAVKMDEANFGDTVPIGRPIANVQVHILDANGQPAPIGVPGELYIGGAGVARGYLNRPELTAERFVELNVATNGHGAVPQRFYKTGDQALWLPAPAGELPNLAFLGRLDHQVKIRGFRVELGEIEAALRAHPEVQDAIVVATAAADGEQRLIAYLVATAPTTAGTLTQEKLPSEVRGYLRDKLPAYMIPAAFIVMAALPFGPNGKVARDALPAPTARHFAASEAFIAPRTIMEEQLAAIWARVLGLPAVGVQDDLFALGGHSLVAIQLLAQIRRQLQVEVPLQALFDQPTVAGLASWIEARLSTAETPLPAIQRAPRQQTMPASFAQERVHFVQQIAPEGSAYQFQETLRIQGDLNVAALEAALTEMIRRHEIFRTTFPAVDGRLVQMIQPPYLVQLPLVDLQDAPVVAQPAAVARLVDEAVLAPFDLNRLPLIRWTLVRLAPTEHLLIHVEHHMVHDGWSFNLFLRETLQLYPAFLQGQPSPLAEPTLQFADFAHWQRQWVETPAAQAQLAYWRTQLAGSAPLLELPYDRPRPLEQTYAGNMIRMDLPVALSQGLRQLSRQAGATLFMTMFAAFSTLIHRYTGQDDLLIGTAVANRRHQETEGLIGMIVNNIVLRTDMAGNPAFRELLNRVRRVTLDGYANEDLPFDKVVEALKPARNLSYNPLFQVMFSFHDSGLPELKLPGLTINLHEAITNRSAKFDLDVVAIPRAEQRVGRQARETGLDAEGITLVWEYNSDLFDAATIQRMMDHYLTLVQAVVADPGRPLTHYPLLTDADRQALRTWNATDKPYATAVCLHHLIEAQAARTPHAVALRHAERQLSYHDLNTRANQLAHYLQRRGVGPDVIVGLCLPRSPELLVGMLAILKAGGAYLPLDPAYPAAHLNDLIADTQAPIVLTQQDLVGKVQECGAQMLCLEPDWSPFGTEAATNPVSPVQPHNLAYVIYTSGSTGKPKGVLIEHRSIVNFTQAAIDLYGITANDRVLQFASSSFDAAAEEIFPCLGQGGELVLRTEEMIQSIPGFIETSRELGLTVWDLPTAYWHLLTGELVNGALSLPSALRLVIIGGERALPERVNQWRARVGATPVLLNTYGPTEGTVVATTCNLSTLDAAQLTAREVPIGRPISNVQVYLLDQQLHPTPVGVAGELHIGGVGVARGYLHRPELTAEKFIRDPFATDPAARLYKTGDLARYRADGTIEYVGRLDNQVKIRGLRIELGEIETVLSQHPRVAQVAVLAREDTPGQKWLVAYVVDRAAARAGAADQAPASRDLPDLLRNFLQQKLPSHMVPAHFVTLAALPMTPSGKINHRALPAPAAGQNGGQGEFVAPTTPVEQTLATIWAAVLRLKQVSVHDNFFELGGDSIISIQLVSRANQVGLRFTPKQLFQYQTIAELAPHVQLATDVPRPVAANQGAVTGAVPLTPIQHWFFDQGLPQSHFFNQSALLTATTTLEPAYLQRAVAHLLAHHDALRLRYIATEDETRKVWRQFSAPNDETLFVSLVDLDHLTPEEERQAIARANVEAQTSLRLDAGPLMRVTLFQRDGGRPDSLLIVIHHLAVDGISWRILLEDLATAYAQCRRGEAIHLPRKTTSFQDWTRRLVTHAGSEKLAAEMAYWQQPATRTLAALPIDDDAAPAHNTLDSAATVVRRLSVEESRALLQDAPAAYNTQINDLLLTALVQTMWQWTGQLGLLVDLEGHGREELFADVDLSRTVGWFTTLFPVYLHLEDVAGDRLAQPGAALKAIKEQLRRLPNRGIGYGLLRYLHPDPAIRTTLQAQPQAAVSFNYLGQFDQVLTAAGDLGHVKDWRSDQSRQGRRSHQLAVSGLITGGQLEIMWEYSANLHRPATVEQLAAHYMAALRALIAHCQSSNSGGYTPSDFSATKLKQKQLDKLMAKIQKGR